MSHADAVVGRLAWEHTHREFLPALLLLRALADRGIQTELCHVSSLRESDPGREVLFFPFYYDDLVRAHYLAQARLAHAWLVNLAYEQMHFRCGRGYLLPDGQFARESMLHCAWGPRFRSLLIEHGIAEERIFLTGHPRFDIYSHPSLLLGRKALSQRYGLRKDVPWVLVPYNFNMAYISPAQRELLVKRRYALTPEFLAGFGQARDAFTTMVRQLSDRFPETEFILRVHPAGFEAETLYHGETRTRSNLFVIADFDIANWITEAALTIVWNSTSSMEALVAGRPVVSYEPQPFSEIFDFDVNRILTTFSSLDDVVSLVADPTQKLEYDWPLFESWYQHRDGRNQQRLADVAVRAKDEFERFECRSRVALTRHADLGWRLERKLGRNSLARRLVQKVFALDTVATHDPPDARALGLAVSELSVSPVGDWAK